MANAPIIGPVSVRNTLTVAELNAHFRLYNETVAEKAIKVRDRAIRTIFYQGFFTANLFAFANMPIALLSTLVITGVSAYLFLERLRNTPEVRKCYALGIMCVVLINFFLHLFLLDGLLFFPVVSCFLYASIDFSIHMYNKACIEQKFRNLQENHFRHDTADQITISVQKMKVSLGVRARVREFFDTDVQSLVDAIQTCHRIRDSRHVARFPAIQIKRVAKPLESRDPITISAAWFQSAIFPWSSYDQEEIKNFLTFILCARTRKLT